MDTQHNTTSGLGRRKGLKRDFPLRRIIAMKLPRLAAWLLLVLLTTAGAAEESTRVDLEYFPSRLHAFVFRNWDIVPVERIATVLGTNPLQVLKTGKALGLPKPEKISAEMQRRNVELIIRRNWPLVPRAQIEALLGYSAKELDDFLGKEIFLRALLAAPPDGLTTLRYEDPSTNVVARTKWFADRMKKHQAAGASMPVEPRMFFTNELCRVHDPADFVPDTKPKDGDADLSRGWSVVTNESSLLLENALADFAAYCKDVHHARLRITKTKSAKKNIVISRDERLKTRGQFALDISADSISIRAGDDRAISRALIELERRMGERGGPFLNLCNDTMTPSFTPRYVSSYFSLLTDVLGQDVVDPFPDEYLNRIAHQDADGIWIYTLLQDLVPSPVFEGMGVGSEARIKHLREIVRRASRHGLKVYLYFNEPRAQFLPFFDKYPQVKGQPEGNTAALCTSAELVQQHLRGSCKNLFEQVPGLGGIFVISASENLCNCYSHARNAVTACPRCSKRSPADVIAESIRCMAEGVWAADPKARVIVWDWSWHSLFGETVPGEIIKRLPKGVLLMADFERGTKIVRGGIPMNVEEYSISTIGPSPRAQLRAKQAAENGFDFLAKIQLSTTWECGTVPFIPVPNLLARKAIAMRNTGVTGTMQTWTIGSFPSPDTEAFAVAQWNPTFSENDVLRYVAERRYGSAAADGVVRAWKKMSDAFEQFPFSSSPYASPLQHGPSIPWYAHHIPRPYGHASLFNPKDDWRNWTPPYPQDVMAKLLRDLSAKWQDGMADFQRAMAHMPTARRKIAERDQGVAWMVDYTYRAYANALHFYGARDGGDGANMKRIAAEEIKNTEEALRHVNADSRLGWEAELQYFYRPNDVLERLVSLDAIVNPPLF
jgi:PAS domain-containing protein